MDDSALEYKLPPLDAPIKRITISHSDGKWMLNDGPLTRWQYEKVIMLGMTYSRIFFELNNVPACRSSDGEYGNPSEMFPAHRSNFPPDHIEEAMAGKTQLSCGACVFGKWSSDPYLPRKSKRPECVLQIMVPLLVPPRVDAVDEPFILASCAFQRSAEQPIVNHMRNFANRGVPSYSVFTELLLDINLGNGFKYSVPKFKEGSNTSLGLWPYFSALFASAKSRLNAPPAPKQKKEGGMLSVEDTLPATYTGGFFG